MGFFDGFSTVAKSVANNVNVVRSSPAPAYTPRQEVYYQPAPAPVYSAPAPRYDPGPQVIRTSGGGGGSAQARNPSPVKAPVNTQQQVIAGAIDKINQQKAASSPAAAPVAQASPWRAEASARLSQAGGKAPVQVQRATPRAAQDASATSLLGRSKAAAQALSATSVASKLPQTLAKKSDKPDADPRAGGVGSMLPGQTPTPGAVPVRPKGAAPLDTSAAGMGGTINSSRLAMERQARLLDGTGPQASFSNMTDAQLSAYVNALSASDPNRPRQTIWGTPGFQAPEGDGLGQPAPKPYPLTGGQQMDALGLSPFGVGPDGYTQPPMGANYGDYAQAQQLADQFGPGNFFQGGSPTPVQDPNNGTSFTDLLGGARDMAGSAFGAFDNWAGDGPSSPQTGGQAALQGGASAVAATPGAIVDAGQYAYGGGQGAGGSIVDAGQYAGLIPRSPWSPGAGQGNAYGDGTGGPTSDASQQPYYSGPVATGSPMDVIGSQQGGGTVNADQYRYPATGGGAPGQAQPGAAPGFGGNAQQNGADFTQMIQNVTSDPNSGLTLGEPGSFANQADEYLRMHPDEFIGHYGQGDLGGGEAVADGGYGGDGGGGYGGGGGGGWVDYGGGGYGGYGGGGYGGGGYSSGGGYGSGSGSGQSDAATGPMGGWANRYNPEGAGAILGNPSSIARDTLLDLGIENQQLSDLLSDRLTSIVSDILPIIQAYAKTGKNPNTAGIINFFHEVALRLLMNDTSVQNIPEMLRNWFKTGGEAVSADTLKELLDANNVSADADTATVETN